jgi:hypothetical protein
MKCRQHILHILQYIDLDYEPHRVLELNDGNILVGSLDDRVLGLHDSNFQLIRKISQVFCDSSTNYEYNIWHTGLDKSANGDVYIKADSCVCKLNKDFKIVRDIHVHCPALY